MTGLASLGEAFIGSPASRVLIVVLVALATATLIATVGVIFGRSQARVERRLAGYEMLGVASAPADAGDAISPETRIVQQAVQLAGRLAKRTGLLARTEVALEQADLPLRPAEVLFYVPTFAILVGLIVELLSSPGVALLAVVVVLSAPAAYVLYRRDKRLQEFERQLPDTLTLLAGGMRAGFSFLQALETVADETSDPMRGEMQRVFNEARLGRAIEDALEDVAARMRSQDLAWVVMAIRIQREVGGNLAELLDTVADTMTKRERMRREIRALTAEGRLSAIVLSIFPPAFGLMLYAMTPEYMRRLFDESIGVIAVVVAACLTATGWIWLRKVVDIEV